MIELEKWCPRARNRLDKEVGSVKGQKEKAMAAAVCRKMKEFCEQDEEFAQAVVQGGSFADCMAQVAKGVRNCISDIDAYKKAVQFYFPGAEIRVQMSIDLIGQARGEEPKAEPKQNGRMILNLADYFK